MPRLAKNALGTWAPSLRNQPEVLDFDTLLENILVVVSGQQTESRVWQKLVACQNMVEK